MIPFYENCPLLSANVVSIDIIKPWYEQLLHLISILQRSSVVLSQAWTAFETIDPVANCLLVMLGPSIVMDTDLYWISTNRNFDSILSC